MAPRACADLRQAGALCCAQDEASSAVFGMPRAAIELGAAEFVLPPPAIGPRSRGACGRRDEPAAARARDAGPSRDRQRASGAAACRSCARSRSAAAGSPAAPTSASYVAALAADELPGEWEALATLLTIKESTFFRVPLQWERIRDLLLPELVLARSGSRRLRFWSAACAAGEEPATLALVLDESPSLAGWDWRILATDLDPDALAHARRGLYGERAVAGVPGKMLAASFTRQGVLYELDPRLRARIDYQQLNLSRLPYRLAEPELRSRSCCATC